MAQPIQQLTRKNHSQDREGVPFTVISRKEKFGKVLYEKRHYEKGKWACVKVHKEQYEQSVCLGFMKIMRYICEQNSSGLYLGMTVPIVTIIHTGESASDIPSFVTVAYYLPGGLQDEPPEPYDPDLIIEEWPPVMVYASCPRLLWQPSCGCAHHSGSEFQRCPEAGTSALDGDCFPISDVNRILNCSICSCLYISPLMTFKYQCFSCLMSYASLLF
ncbi:heme-binding protein 1-like isoform X2 [Paroedura picta]|uniref:heme-binding protein 1-like isoform X2 n=1 Tax=Paroedura picta TaxID=143630 RepID=UPI004057A6E1